MYIRVRTYLLFLALFAFCGLSQAAVEQEKLNRLLDLSGLTKQVGDFPGMVEMGLMQGLQQSSSISQETQNLLRNSAQSEIDPDVVISEIKTRLNNTLSSDEADELLAWYKSDIGRKITAAEEAASTPDAYQKMVESADQLMAQSERVERARRLNELLNATEMAMDMQQNAGVAVYSALMTALLPDQELNLGAYESQMASMEPQMRQQLDQIVTLSFVYTYRDIEISALKKYEQFLERPASKKFTDATVEGLNDGFQKVISNWSQRLANSLKDGA